MTNLGHGAVGVVFAFIHVVCGAIAHARYINFELWSPELMSFTSPKPAFTLYALKARHIHYIIHPLLLRYIWIQ